MSEDKKNRQQLACEFIHDNYVAFNRLRFDEIAQKVQIRDAAEPQCSGEGNWRYITNADINTMVCDCSAETGANITSKEVLTVLNAGSQYIPRVHPLREYVKGLEPWNGYDWIEYVANQVSLKDPKRTELWQKCFKKWFVAMVAGWMRDEAVNHTVLVLIGEQGCGKTTWLE